MPRKEGPSARASAFERRLVGWAKVVSMVTSLEVTIRDARAAGSLCGCAAEDALEALEALRADLVAGVPSE